jgi:glucose/arabinose dehydrogenase
MVERRRLSVRWALSLVGALLAAFASGPIDRALAANVPTGFSDALVTTVDGMGPTALAWLPDGDLLIADQGGKLYRLAAGASTATVALDLTGSVCTEGEQGLLGVAVDPDFAHHPYVYTYETARTGANCGQRVNRVSRWSVVGGATIDVDSEVRLIDNIPTPSAYHKGGDLEFGGDGDLYVSVGDGECNLDGNGCQDNNPNARRLDVLLGKILRIDRDGDPAAGNPFTDAGAQRCAQTGQSANGQPCQEIYATGLRNPFRIAFDPNGDGDRFSINDVGGSKWEEIDLGKAGADYGWNVREGFCKTGQSRHCKGGGQFQSPIFAYAHRTGCDVITGGAFVPESSGWGAPFNGQYLYADFGCGKIFLLAKKGGKYKGKPFATGANQVVDLRFSPDGTALYYTLLNGQIRKIARA